MSNEFKLSVDKRNLLNKGGRKRARKDGIIPGVYYSHDSKKSIPFSISKKEIFNAQKADTQIFSILVGDKKRNVLFKAIQYHPVTDEIIHIDLYGIKMDQAVSVSVALNILGNAKGIVEGGILVQSLNEIEIECLPSDIPQSVDVDISNLEIGESFRCENLHLDEKFVLKTAEDQIIVSVTQPAQEEEVQATSDVEGDDSGVDQSESSDSDDSSKEESGDANKEG